MKYVIPKSRTTEKITENMISTSSIDQRKIIVIDQYMSDAIGILTKLPDGNWFVTDILNSRNLWSRVVNSDSSVVLDRFNGVNDRIYQFDTNQEFVRWLAKKLNISSLKEPTPCKRDSRGRFCSSKPKII